MAEEQQNRAVDQAHIEKAWQWWRSIGSPRHVCAPMVNNSELAFRMLVRQYGVQLTYTPMLPARSFNKLKTEEERKKLVEPNPLDRPLIVQFCADDPEELLCAALKVQDWCDAVDLNLGCPQAQAVRDHYGSILMEEPDLVQRMVARVSAGLRIPFTCKIRVFQDIPRTVAFAQMLQASGCSMLTVHGRTRSCTHHEGECDWSAIRAVKRALAIPVLANGGPVRTLSDVSECLRATQADGVMSAIGLLLDPHLFAPGPPQLRVCASASAPGPEQQLESQSLASGGDDSAAQQPGSDSEAVARDSTRDASGQPDALLLALEYLAAAEDVPSTPAKSMRDHCQALLRPFLSPRVPSSQTHAQAEASASCQPQPQPHTNPAAAKAAASQAPPSDASSSSSCPPGPASPGHSAAPPLPAPPGQPKPAPASAPSDSRAPVGTPSAQKLQKVPPRGHPDLWSVLCCNQTTTARQCRLLVLHLATRLRHPAAPDPGKQPLPSLREIKRGGARGVAAGGAGEDLKDGSAEEGEGMTPSLEMLEALD